MSNEIRLQRGGYRVARKEPPCDFGDVRKSSIDANIFPYSPQPQDVHGKYCIYAFHKGRERVFSNLDIATAFRIARKLNNNFWSRYVVQ